MADLPREPGAGLQRPADELGRETGDASDDEAGGRRAVVDGGVVGVEQAGRLRADAAEQRLQLERLVERLRRARERELAMRAALGGNRRRLIRQLIVESIVLAGIGGGAGLLLATFGIDALIQLAPEGLPRAGAVSLDHLAARAVARNG